MKRQSAKSDNSSLSQNANYILVSFEKGFDFNLLGDYARARADWERVLRINPNHATVRNNLEVLRQMEY
ncbi:MAG: hypothetical protein LBK73_03065 [Treponema sp.]|jgi:lipoprotein NlpI|nr:hypothetical protein [Treponema sp.]